MTTATIYTCDQCKGTGPWGPTWRWYGSYRDLDNFGPDGVAKLCSEACRDKWSTKHAAAIVADGAGRRSR